MEISVTKKLNPSTQITIKFTDERDVKEAILKATPFMQMQGVCGCCGSDAVDLKARQTKDGQYIYVELECKKCRSRQEFGEYKVPKGTLFLKRWEKFVPKSAGEA